MLSRHLAPFILCVGLSVQAQATSALPDLQGHWTGEAELCHMLCSFTLVNIKEGNNRDMQLQFDRGTWSENASGYLRYERGIRYVLTNDKSGDAAIPFDFRDGKLIALGDVVYHRDTTQ